MTVETPFGIIMNIMDWCSSLISWIEIFLPWVRLPASMFTLPDPIPHWTSRPLLKKDFRKAEIKKEEAEKKLYNQKVRERKRLEWERAKAEREGQEAGELAGKQRPIKSSPEIMKQQVQSFESSCPKTKRQKQANGGATSVGASQPPHVVTSLPSNWI